MHLFFGKPKAGASPAASSAAAAPAPQVDITGQVSRLQAHMETLEKA